MQSLEKSRGMILGRCEHQQGSFSETGPHTNSTPQAEQFFFFISQRETRNKK
jgi:hypothetical protein